MTQTTTITPARQAMLELITSKQQARSNSSSNTSSNSSSDDEAAKKNKKRSSNLIDLINQQLRKSWMKKEDQRIL